MGSGDVRADMTDEVSGVGLTIHHGHPSGRLRYSITTHDGSLELSIAEWLGLVDLADRWREEV